MHIRRKFRHHQRSLFTGPWASFQHSLFSESLSQAPTNASESSAVQKLVLMLHTKTVIAIESVARRTSSRSQAGEQQVLTHLDVQTIVMENEGRSCLRHACRMCMLQLRLFPKGCCTPKSHTKMFTCSSEAKPTNASEMRINESPSGQFQLIIGACIPRRSLTKIHTTLQQPGLNSP